MKKNWYRSIKLSKEAKHAKMLLLKLCKVLTVVGGRKFTLGMNAFCNTYEGHVIDSGRCFRDSDNYDDWRYDPNGPDEIGSVFFGGHFSRKKHGKAALSKAYVSLLEDCLGIGELKEQHNLTDHLKYFGPKLDLNFPGISMFEQWIDCKLKLLEGTQNDIC